MVKPLSFLIMFLPCLEYEVNFKMGFLVFAFNNYAANGSNIHIYHIKVASFYYNIRLSMEYTPYIRNIYLYCLQQY